MKKLIALLLILAVCPAGLLPVSAANPESMVEAEWCEDTNIPYNAEGENGLPVYRSASAFSNGLAVNMTSTEAMPQDGWYMNFDVTAPAGGYYDMQFVTSAVDSKFTSPYTVSVNDGSELFVTNSSAMRTGDGYNTNWAKYRLRIYLEQGVNAISFRVTDYTENTKNTASPRVVFYFDYFSLRYSEEQAVTEDCEYFFDASASAGISAATDNTENSALRGDKKYLKFSGSAAGSGDRKSVKVRVFAPKAGAYAMTSVCTRLGVGYTGQWDFADENGNVYPFDAEHAAMLREVLPSPSNAFCEYKLGQKVTLAAGYNIFTITAYPRGEGTDFATYIDSISFAPDESKAVTIEAESCQEPGYWTLGGGLLTLNQTDEHWGYEPVRDAFEIAYDFTVPEAQSYFFYFDMAAANGSNNNVSRLEISVDDEVWNSFDTANLKYYSQSAAAIGASYGPGVYVYGRDYKLDEGNHRLRLRVTEPILPDDRRLQYYAAIDKIMVLPADRTARQMDASFSAPFLLIGGTGQITTEIYDNFGGIMRAEDFDITYSVPADSAAAVADDGRVTGLKFGTAMIDITASSPQMGTVQTSVPVTVISEYQGICVTGIDKNGASVNIRLINPYHTQNPASVIVTEYTQENGAVMLKAVHTIDISQRAGAVGEDEMRGLLEKTYIVNLDYPDAKTDVYFWSDTVEMISLWESAYE